MASTPRPHQALLTSAFSTMAHRASQDERTGQMTSTPRRLASLPYNQCSSLKSLQNVKGHTSAPRQLLHHCWLRAPSSARRSLAGHLELWTG